jgi:ABC-type Fe3+-hydroxamate transport system substrate-binding protein
MMTVGGDTFIHSMMKIAGFKNVFAGLRRYPEITIQQLHEAKPDLLLLSSEPFPFKQKHIEELQPHLPGMPILLADGEMFSWYGSRMQYAAAYFQKLRDKINPS